MSAGEQVEVLIGDEWGPLKRVEGIEWEDPGDREDSAEPWTNLGDQTWSMTVEIAESEPVVSLIRRLEREARQRRMLARWWLRFPFVPRARCSAGWLI